MTEKRFINKGKDIFQYGEWWCSANGEHCADVIATAINGFIEENEQLKQQRKELLRLIDNNIEIYENINTNVEFHQGEIQGKLTLLYNLRKVILND